MSTGEEPIMTAATLSDAEATRTRASVRLAFAALVLAMLPAVLDQTILATALPTIATDLGRLSDVSWLVTVYVVAATAATPLWGKLGDRHGRKRLLQVSLTAFVAASALCGAAQDITQLIALRALQGAAAGGLMTLAMAAVGDLVSPRERGRYQGYIAATFAGATVLGPLVGGLLVDHASWRWVFYVNLPVGSAALLAIAAKLPSPDPGRPAHRLDVPGALLLAGATCALLLVCVWGGDRYDWTSAPIIGLAAAAGTLGAMLVARERRAEDPIVPLGMLRSPAVGVASGALFLTTASLFAVVVFVPLFLQATTGATPTEAGLLMAPMMLGTTISTAVAGRHISRTGRYRHYPPIGLAAMAASLLALAAVAPEHSRAATGVALAAFGLGFGLVTQVLMVAVQNAVDRRELGTATGVTTFFRALGGSVGAAVLGAVFAAQSGTSARGGVVGGVDPRLASAIADAVQTVFLVAAPLAILGAFVAARLPAVGLRTESSG
jgi:EmrB/QacA subfamily drug resistance transporter